MYLSVLDLWLIIQLGTHVYTCMYAMAIHTLVKENGLNSHVSGAALYIHVYTRTCM